MQPKQKCVSISTLGERPAVAKCLPRQAKVLFVTHGSPPKRALLPGMGNMIEQFSGVVLGLARASREQTASTFQHAALELAKPMLGFDSALWGSGSIRMGEPVTHAMYLYNQPEEYWRAWTKYAHQDRLIGMMLASPGITVNADEAEVLKGMEIYDKLCKPYGIEHVLCTCIIDPITSLYNVISLYRSDRNAPFSEEERAFKQNLMPHWIETHRTNHLFHLMNARLPPDAAGYCAAAADREGVLHLIEPEFTELLRAEWPTWRGPTLPPELHGLFDGEEGRYTGDVLVVKSCPMDDLFMLRARRKSQVDRLSERERQVALLFSDGSTYKEIAKVLKIAPSTVRNHLNAIYIKLGVRNKAEMVSSLKTQG